MDNNCFKKVFSLIFIFTIIVFTFSGCNNNKDAVNESSDDNMITNTKIIKVLCIGHSYSNNSTQYASQMVLGFGGNLEISSLYYQGCSPKQHLDFHNNNQKVYALYTNGVRVKSDITMKEVLEAQQYDYITFQGDASSTDHMECLEPLLPLSQIIRNYQPNAEFLLHQTWSLCGELLPSTKIPGTDKFYTHKNMGREYFDATKANFKSCAEKLGGIKIVPVGEAVQIAKEEGGFSSYHSSSKSIYADLVGHLSDYGKYMAAAVWTQYFYGDEIDVRQSRFAVAGIDEKDAAILKEIAYKVVNDYKK